MREQRLLNHRRSAHFLFFSTTFGLALAFGAGGGLAFETGPTFEPDVAVTLDDFALVDFGLVASWLLLRLVFFFQQQL